MNVLFMYSVVSTLGWLTDWASYSQQLATGCRPVCTVTLSCKVVMTAYTVLTFGSNDMYNASINACKAGGAISSFERIASDLSIMTVSIMG